jgi:hypothetical protein
MRLMARLMVTCLLTWCVVARQAAADTIEAIDLEYF